MNGGKEGSNDKIVECVHENGFVISNHHIDDELTSDVEVTHIWIIFACNQ